MSIADTLWSFSILALSFSFAFLYLDLTKLHPFVLWLELMLVFHFMGQILCLDACVRSHWLKPFGYFIYSLLCSDTYHFSISVISVASKYHPHLLIPYATNKVDLGQILFKLMQPLPLGLDRQKYEKIWFYMIEAFIIHPLFTGVFILLQRS